jgi:hypothetical protein
MLPIATSPEPQQSIAVSNTTARPIMFADLIGGLGNQIWIFLSSQGIARGDNARTAYSPEEIQMMQGVFALVIDQRNKFEIVAREAFSNKKRRDGSKNPNEYKPIFLHRDTHFEKFFLQNPKYLANTPNNFAQEARQRLQFQPCSVLTEAHELLRGMAGTIAGCNATDETTTIVKKWVGMHVRRFPDRHISEPLPSVPAMVAQIDRVLQRCHQDHAAETQHVSTPCATTGDENGDSQTNVTLASCCALIFSNDPDWAKMKIRV